MTSAAEAVSEQHDVRTIVGGGIKLGVATAIGVAAFALVSRALDGSGETIVQVVLVLAGGAVFAYLPAVWVRPRTADGIAWTAMVGLLGALTFTVLDVAVLRPAAIYHWTWDAIGGGSGFWYHPVWWMGSAVLAWLGGWVMAQRWAARHDANPWMAAGQTAGLGVILFAVLTAVGAAPFHPAVAALGFTIALVLHVPLAAAMHRR